MKFNYLLLSLTIITSVFSSMIFSAIQIPAPHLSPSAYLKTGLNTTQAKMAALEEQSRSKGQTQKGDTVYVGQQ